MRWLMPLRRLVDHVTPRHRRNENNLRVKPMHSLSKNIHAIVLTLAFAVAIAGFSASGAVAQASDAKPVFLQLGPDTLRLNGDEIALDALAGSSLAEAEKGTVLLVSLGADVDAQRLTDVLVKLREMPALQVSVLGG